MKLFKLSKRTAHLCIKLIIALIAILIISSIIFERIIPTMPITFGVSFSPTYAEYLGLDWKKNYLEILQQLQVKKLRLPSFWKEIEKEEGKFNFVDTDFMIDEAGKENAQIILVVGLKQPRWPECQAPEWAKKLTTPERRKKTLAIIEKVVNRYKNYPQIWAWQVENEPLFQFGENCDKPDREFLKKEVELVKKLDPLRPTIVTDTGEWRPWITPMKLSDILGISLYRKAHNKLLGDYSYPFPTWMYPLKYKLVKAIFAPQNQRAIIAELQGEPWSEKPLTQTPLQKQMELFSEKNFKENIGFTQKVGFDEAYLWGVEWWYFMKEKGYPGYWEYAKNDLF